jgi:transposase
MEATGMYYLDLAIELHAAGLPVSVINPRSFHNFAKLMLQNSKTDEIDAQLLAEYGERMGPRLWVPPTAEQMMLRAIGRHINRLIGPSDASQERAACATSDRNEHRAADRG